MDMIDLLSFINAHHGTTFHLQDRLPGGCQGGAHALEDAAGRRAVLKCRPFSEGALEVTSRLREAGYPTPAILCAGEAADGTPYWVYDFVPGEPMGTLTEEYLDQVFDLIELQVDLNPGSSQSNVGNWSQYAYDVVFAGESGWGRLLRTYSPQTAQFMALLESRTAPYAGKTLPNRDAVHGDLAPDNMLVQDGKVAGIVDTTYAGYGTRVTDLATLFHYAYLYDYGDAVRRRLHTHLLQITDIPTLTICLAHRILAMVAWAVRHDPPAAVEHYMRCSRAMLDDLR